jgi:hypothetical protein
MKIPIMYYFSGNCAATVPIPSICKRFMYSQDRSTYFQQRSQTHECGNWDCGRAISFRGLFVSNFPYLFFAVCALRLSVKSNFLYRSFRLVLYFFLHLYCTSGNYFLERLVFAYRPMPFSSEAESMYVQFR